MLFKHDELALLPQLLQFLNHESPKTMLLGLEWSSNPKVLANN